MDSQPLRILFVEDDEVDQLAFKRQVATKKLNYEIQFASSSKEAKDMLEANNCDIVITDYNLGDGNALDVLDSVKKIPLIVTTGAGDEQIAISTLKAGAYDYIVKDQERKYLEKLPSTIENALQHKKESQQFEMLATVLMNINDMVTITDLKNKLIFVNDAFVNNYGYTRSELIGKCIDIVRPKNDGQKVIYKSMMGETLKGGWKGELINRKKDGTEFSVYLSTSAIYDAAGNPTHLFGVSNDITESKKAKEELAKEKERLSVTLRNIGAGVITTDDKGIITSMNKAGEEISGWKEENAVGEKICTVFNSDEKTNQCKNLVENVLKTGESIHSTEPREIVFSKDNVKMIIANAAPLKDNGKNLHGVVLAIEDVTDRMKLEEEIRKSHKLESLGVLAGGIAHDFNNILTSIIGHISLGMMYVQPTDTIYPNLEGALKGCERSRDLTHQLLTFAKGGAPIKENASIVDIVKDTSEFASRGSGTMCKFDIKPDIWTVEIDVGQISQVINNLVINATQAMPQGGKIYVNVENVTNNEELSKNRFLKNELHYVKIIMRDEGTGIPEKIIHQIFDPYFSTKKKGSGLGLASSYSIIKQHDGYIGVESEVNVGTTFTMYLPAIPNEKIKKTEDNKTEIVKGTANILVMDDEQGIRDVVSRMLTSLGYTANFTEHGDDTIKVYKNSLASKSPIDVLILDMTIPGGKGGKETIVELLKINPKVKAIVASGYSEDPVVAKFKDHGFSGRLLKPFDFKTLSKVLNEVIEKK